MSTTNLTLDKLVDNDFNSGATIEPNKLAQGAVYYATMVFKALSEPIVLNSATPKFGSIKVGGGNISNEEAKFEFTLGYYKNSTFTALSGWTGSFTVSEKDGTVSNKSCTIDGGSYSFAKGTQLAYKVKISSTNSARVAKTTLSDFKLSIDYDLQTYTVTWKNGDTVLETDTSVAYGTTPTYDGSTPSKSSDNVYSYTFSHWEDANGNKPSSVTGNITYTAKFTSTKILYKVTVVASPTEGGTVTGGSDYEYNSSVTITAEPKTDYEFLRWNDGVTTKSRQVTVTGAVTYTAYFKLNKVLVNTSQTLGILVNLTESPEVLKDLTKVYG